MTYLSVFLHFYSKLKVFVSPHVFCKIPRVFHSWVFLSLKKNEKYNDQADLQIYIGL